MCTGGVLVVRWRTRDQRYRPRVWADRDHLQSWIEDLGRQLHAGQLTREKFYEKVRAAKCSFNEQDAMYATVPLDLGGRQMKDDQYGNLAEKMDEKVDSEEGTFNVQKMRQAGKAVVSHDAQEYTQPACSLPMQVSQATILRENEGRGDNCWTAPENPNEDV